MATCDPNEVIQPCWACRSPQELQAAMVGLLCDISAGGGGGGGTVTSVAMTVPTFLSVAGSPIVGAGTLAVTLSGTALPVANGGTGITSFGAGVATWLGAPSSANLATAVTDETGSGALVFANTPTLVTPILGTPTSGTLTNCTGLPTTALVNGDFSALAIYDYLGVVKTDTNTSYTTVNGDTGKIVELNNGSAIAVTLHKTAPIGHNCVFVQMGAGQVTFAPEGGGGIMRSYLSLTKTAGQYANVSAYVRTNAGGSAAEWVLSGAMA